jgi:excinuclease ABC subunit A
MLKSLSNHYQFDLDTPFENLSQSVRDLILYGSGTTEINFINSTEKGTALVRKKTFEGVIPNMQRRYRETESNSVRDELTKYLSQQPCTACQGTRLNESGPSCFDRKPELTETHRVTDWTRQNLV